MSAGTDPRTRGAVAMVLASILSVQCGAALATSLFDRVGPAGTVLLRSALGALVLLALSRPALRSPDRARLRDIALFAVALAGMNLCFYEALERLPLGVTVTLEFVGPLSIAVFGSRRPRDLLWAALAAAGVLLLSGGLGGAGSDPLGVVFALSAGAFWGAYVLLSSRVGRHSPGLGGLALAMVFSSLLVAPFGIVAGGAELLAPAVLAVGLGVGLLSSAIPYTLELQALRRLPGAAFGIIVSLEPAVAALIGLIALAQGLAAAELVGIALVISASAGALGSTSAPAPRDA